MFNPAGVLPEYLQPAAVIEDETHILLVDANPEQLRHVLLLWLESEFFPYEEQPYVAGAERQDVAIIRTGCLPKPILITIVPEGKV